ATETALSELGAKLGTNPDDVARGIIRIANNNMVNALKLVSLNRGHDPRDFILVAFGGGGAMHAVALGQELGVKKVVIPAGASVFSAWGMMMSDLRRDYFVTKLADLKTGAGAIIEGLFAETEAVALRQFGAEGIGAEKVKFLRYGKFRYQNQEHTTEVLVGSKISDAKLAEIEAAFHETYEREYTYRLKAPVELVGIHVVASAEVGKLTMQEKPKSATPASAAVKGTRKVDYALEGIHDATIYDGTKLEPGMNFSGPAVIEDPGTTVVIHPGNRVEVDGFGNIHIHIKA
ncbi:MAG: hydantoinase/oxoprolinase family protein, partial [Devosia sp.]